MSDDRYKEHGLFIESAERFRDQELEPFVDEWEELGYFPDKVFQRFAEQGFLGMLIPEEFGGVGGDYRLAAAWCEVFGETRSTGMVVALAMHALVITHAIAKYGSDSTKQRILPGSMTGDLIGAYAFTEPGAGSDLANLRTKAELKNGRWVLNGTKIFITNGARADYVLILARTDPNAGYRGFTTFIVDTDAPGFTVNRTLDKLGWLSSDTAELFLDNVEVDPSEVLGSVGAGWTQASNNLSWERLMLTLVTLGGMRAAYKELVSYASNRVAFGLPLTEHGVVKDDLLRMRSKIRFAEAITSRALSGLIAGENIRSLAAVAKRLVATDALWLADRSIQLHGGYGYTREYPAERWWRDLRLMPIGGGTDEIMANIVRKEQGW